MCMYASNLFVIGLDYLYSLALFSFFSFYLSARIVEAYPFTAEYYATWELKVVSLLTAEFASITALMDLALRRRYERRVAEGRHSILLEISAAGMLLRSSVNDFVHLSDIYSSLYLLVIGL